MRSLIKNIILEYTKSLNEVGPSKWTDEALRQEAQKYNSLIDFQRGNKSAYFTAYKRGPEFFNDITSHMKKNVRWTEDMIRQEAQKYKTRGEFHTKNDSAYRLAAKRGPEFFNDITSHMVRQVKWTDDALRQEAQKYSSRTDFHNGNKSAYEVAKDRKSTRLNSSHTDISRMPSSA